MEMVRGKGKREKLCVSVYDISLKGYVSLSLKRVIWIFLSVSLRFLCIETNRIKRVELAKRIRMHSCFCPRQTCKNLTSCYVKSVLLYHPIVSHESKMLFTTTMTKAQVLPLNYIAILKIQWNERITKKFCMELSQQKHKLKNIGVSEIWTKRDRLKSQTKLII